MKAKTCVSPFGFVCFSTTMFASFSFVKTQRTVSSGPTAIAFAGEPSVQTVDFRSQPAGTVSATEYVPGRRAPESFDCPSESGKPYAS